MHCGQTLDELARLANVRRRVRLGDLENNRVARQARGLYSYREPLNELFVDQAVTGQVDRQTGVVTFSPVCGQQLDGMQNDPAVDLCGNAVFDRQFEKLVGCKLLVVVAFQAQKHFVVFIRVAAQTDNRLKQELETIAVDGLVDQRENAALVGVQAILVDEHVLGLIPQDAVGALGLAGREHGFECQIDTLAQLRGGRDGDRPDGHRAADGLAVDFEKLVLHLGAKLLSEHIAAGLRTKRDDAETMICDPLDQHVAQVFVEPAADLGNDRFRFGQPMLGLQLVEVVDLDDQQSGAFNLIDLWFDPIQELGHRVCAGLDGCG